MNISYVFVETCVCEHVDVHGMKKYFKNNIFCVGMGWEFICNNNNNKNITENKRSRMNYYLLVNGIVCHCNLFQIC